MKYNFIDLYRGARKFNRRHYGVVELFIHLQNKDWEAIIKAAGNLDNLLDLTRQCDYMINSKELIYNRYGLSVMDKAIIIKIASYRDYGNWRQYGDNSIKLERIKDIPIERLEKIPLIDIKNDKLYLTFEK